MAEIKPQIGILGLGSRSTLFYIAQLNQKYKALKGGYNTCPFILLNTNFNDINPFLPNHQTLKKNLLPYLKAVKKLNISRLLIPNITLHETTDLLAENLKPEISIIHPIISTIKSLKDNGKTNVILFGSLYSMKAAYISQYFLENNINVSLPKEDEMRFIDDLRQKVYSNKESQKEINLFNELTKSYTSHKTVVIACTELSIALDLKIDNVYDMVQLQLNEALRQLRE